MPLTAESLGSARRDLLRAGCGRPIRLTVGIDLLDLAARVAQETDPRMVVELDVGLPSCAWRLVGG